LCAIIVENKIINIAADRKPLAELGRQFFLIIRNTQVLLLITAARCVHIITSPDILNIAVYAGVKPLDYSQAKKITYKKPGANLLDFMDIKIFSKDVLTKISTASTIYIVLLAAKYAGYTLYIPFALDIAYS